MATPEASSTSSGFEDINDENQAPAIVKNSKNTITGPTNKQGKTSTTNTTTVESDDMSAASVQSAKSLKDTIKIVSEDVKIVPAGIKIVQDEDRETVEVPVEQQEQAAAASNTNKNPIQDLRRHLAKTVDEQKQNLQKNLGKLNDSTKGVVNKIQSSTEETWKNLQTSTSNLGNEVKERTYQTFDKVGSTTQNLLQEHVEPSFRRSVHALQEIPGNSQRMLEGVTSHSQRVLVGVTSQTSETLVRLGETTQTTYQTHVSPKVDEFHQAHVSPRMGRLVQLHKTYSKYYMGKAPAVTEFFDNHDASLPYQLAKASLLGCSQVLYCENATTGGLIWLSTFILAPWIALAGLSSILTASACSLFVFKEENTPSSTTMKQITEAGANAFLVGTFTATLMGSGWGVLPATIFLGPLCWYVHLQIASYTSAPLLWSSNAVLGVVALMVVATGSPPAAAVVAEEGSFLFMGSLASIFGFVMAAEWTGWLILFGVALCAPVLAASLLAATVVETLCWLVLSGGTTMLYQAGLTAVALVYHFCLTKVLMVVGFLAIVWTCILQLALDALFAQVVGTSFSFTIAFCVATMPLLVSEEPLLGLEKRNLEDEPVCIAVEDEDAIKEPSEDLEQLLDGDADVLLPAEEEVEEAPATEETPLIV